MRDLFLLRVNVFTSSTSCDTFGAPHGESLACVIRVAIASCARVIVGLVSGFREYNSAMQPYGPAALRLVVGAVFAAHGAQKLFGLWGGGGLAGTAAFFAQLGLAPASPLAVAVGIAEFAGGLLLIAGALTFFAALALVIEMVIATWKVHLANGFFINWALTPGHGHGYEFNLTLIGALVSLMLTGAGALSIDGWRARSAEYEAYGRARLRAGKV